MSAYYEITTGKLKDTGEQVALVQIKYDATAIAEIKAIAGSRYHPTIKGWSVPIAARDDLGVIVAAAKTRSHASKQVSGSKIFPGLRGYEEGEL